MSTRGGGRAFIPAQGPFAPRLSGWRKRWQLPGTPRPRTPEFIDPPGYVCEEFEAYLKCGWRAHGFLRVCCERCRAEKRVALSCERRVF